jgi:hypothetical protein
MLALMVSCHTPRHISPATSIATPQKLEHGSEKILFSKVMFRIPAGTRVGGVYDLRRGRKEIEERRWEGELLESTDYNVAAIDRLRHYGYTVVDPSDALFSEDHAVKTRLQLGGVVRAIEVNDYVHLVRSERNYQTANLQIEFQLFDAVREEIRYSKSFEVYGHDEGKRPRAVVVAILNGLDHAMSDREFIAAAVGSTRGAGAVNDGIDIETCDFAAPQTLPKNLPSIMEAVVTLQTGSLSGSGVVVSSRGYILTAAHVVQEGEPTAVLFKSGLQLEASVSRINRDADTALLKLPGRGYPCVWVGGDEAPPIGSTVFVIGSPLGAQLSHSVSKGIVSAHRVLEGDVLLQVDASANPGSSGGPMLDESGRVLAIVSSKVHGIGLEGLVFGVPMQAVNDELSIVWVAPD